MYEADVVIEISRRDKRIAALEAENVELRKSYNELIMGVARKFPNETRHQTALRYILQAEAQKLDAAKEAQS